MRMHDIQVDSEIWNHLQTFAEPFVDTPNSVLRRLFFYEAKEASGSEKPYSTIDIKGVPIALAQIFEVLYEIEINGQTRIDATHRVAAKRGTAPQTIIDKYCRQLSKRANEIDLLLKEPGYKQFKQLLINKFKPHQDVIDVYFDTLTVGLNAADDIEAEDPELNIASLNTPL